MGPGSRRSVVAGLALLGVVGVGWLTGRTLSATDCSTVTGLACDGGGALAVVAVVRRPRSTDPPWVERLAGAALLAYILLATVTEQFAWVGDTRAAAVGVVWLAPLVLGGAVLPRRGAWWAAGGCCAVLFAGTAALTYSANHVSSGVGLVIVWRD